MVAQKCTAYNITNIVKLNLLKWYDSLTIGQFSKSFLLYIDRQKTWDQQCSSDAHHLSSFSHSFRCGSCSRTWRSARVVVLFRYRLRDGRGTVIMRPFGQTCRRCLDDEFDLPGFSERDIEQALLRLFAKIRKNCYGDEDEDDDDGSACSTKVWTKPHESALCEACTLGICCQDED